jgi:hypothetical protein
MTSKEFVDGIQERKWRAPFHEENEGRSVVDAKGKTVASFFSSTDCYVFSKKASREICRRIKAGERARF